MPREFHMKSTERKKPGVHAEVLKDFLSELTLISWKNSQIFNGNEFACVRHLKKYKRKSSIDPVRCLNRTTKYKKVQREDCAQLWKCNFDRYIRQLVAWQPVTILPGLPVQEGFELNCVCVCHYNINIAGDISLEGSSSYQVSSWKGRCIPVFVHFQWTYARSAVGSWIVVFDLFI